MCIYAVYQSWMTGINYCLMTERGYLKSAARARRCWISCGCLRCGAWRKSCCFAALLSSAVRRTLPPIFCFIAAMLLIFGRSFSTTQEHGISPKPTYSRIKANYFSFGYFVGRVLPYQLFDLSKIPVFKQPAPSKVGQGSVQNIVLIMGESESATHLKLFGYGRETSPFFNPAFASRL